MIDLHTHLSFKISYITLGCKLNFAETSSLAKIMAEAGYSKIKAGEVPDVCILNTCSVTEMADKKSRQAIHKLVRQYPHAFIVVTGCFAQLKAKEISEMEGVSLVLGANEKFDLPNHLSELKSNGASKVYTSKTKDIDRFLPSCSQGDRTRYFLKVQDGCDYYCTYCTIPIARGKSRNPEIASLVDQATQVAREGGKEIVLTGVNIGDFGKSTGETFLDLLKALDEVEGIDRFRISSVEPNLLTEEIIKFVSESKRIAPHFHIPLQGGEDELLALMHRRYDTALFASRVKAIKACMPNAFIGVDVIVGSRGETEERFQHALSFIEGLDVSQLHVFAYSERPGTMALQITPIVTSADKKSRSKSLMAVSEKKWRGFYTKQIGAQANVLFEHTKVNGMMHGFTENYVRVELPYDSKLVNQVVRVELGLFNADGTALLAVLR